jgi:tetratricopeptide (TPR) repeat protein
MRGSSPHGNADTVTCGRLRQPHGAVIPFRCPEVYMRPRHALLALIAAAFAAGSLSAVPALADEQPSGVPTLHLDPRGLKGLNPFWQAVKAGDDAVGLQNYDAALVSYKDAIKAEPNNPMGYYRLGEVQVMKGNLKEAETAYQNALRLTSDKPAIKAKVLFATADLKERQRSYDEAVAAWSNYDAFARSNHGPGVFPAVAYEKKKRVQEWQKLLVDSGPVKERIKSRLQEADKKAAESAQSPQNR